MNESKWIDKFPAKMVLAVFTVGGLLLAVYTAFIQKKKPDFQYLIISQTSVYNQTEEVSSINIFVDSIDVQKSNLNVSIFYIKIENAGNADISYGDYDKGLFGIGVTDGSVLAGPYLVTASTPHLEKRFNESVLHIDSSFIQFPCLPLDENDYYIVKIAVLHQNDIIPQFAALGKITGQRDIIIQDIYRDAPSVWATSLAGKWNVQLIRILIYFIIPFISLLLLSLLAILFEKNPIGKDVDSVVKKAKREQYSILPFVLDDFQERGGYHILKIFEVIDKGDEVINDEYKTSLVYMKSEEKDIQQLHFHYSRLEFYEELLLMGYFVKGEDGTISVNRDAESSVRYICNALPRK